jgi:hypothetical protein
MRVFAAVLLLSACQDLHEYQGAWHGGVSADPQLSAGTGTLYPTLDMDITSIDHTRISGTINGMPFSSMEHAAADALAEVRVGHDALRTYFGWWTTYLVIVSVFPDQRVEVRLILGDSYYGVYELHRK